MRSETVKRCDFLGFARGNRGSRLLQSHLAVAQNHSTTKMTSFRPMANPFAKAYAGLASALNRGVAYLGYKKHQIKARRRERKHTTQSSWCQKNVPKTSMNIHYSNIQLWKFTSHSSHSHLWDTTNQATHLLWWVRSHLLFARSSLDYPHTSQ